MMQTESKHNTLLSYTFDCLQNDSIFTFKIKVIISSNNS